MWLIMINSFPELIEIFFTVVLAFQSHVVIEIEKTNNTFTSPFM